MMRNGDPPLCTIRIAGPRDPRTKLPRPISLWPGSGRVPRDQMIANIQRQAEKDGIKPRVFHPLHDVTAVLATRKSVGRSLPVKNGKIVTGVVITRVDEFNAIAGRAGLRPGNIITAVNGQPIKTLFDFQAIGAEGMQKAPVVIEGYAPARKGWRFGTITIPANAGFGLRANERAAIAGQPQR